MPHFPHFRQGPAGIDWTLWCLSGSLYNSRKNRFNIPDMAEPEALFP